MTMGKVALVVAVACTFSGCGGSSGSGDEAASGPPPAVMTSFYVTPDPCNLQELATVQMSAWAQWNFGPSMSTGATWVSLNPAVFTVNGAGLVTGVVAGVATLQVTSTMDPTKIDNVTVNVSVAPPPPPVITTPSPLPDCVAGDNYSETIVATGGTGVLVWSIISGSLPSGFTFDSASGELKGATKDIGSYTFTVQVVDDNLQTDTQVYDLTVS